MYIAESWSGVLLGEKQRKRRHGEETSDTHPPASLSTFLRISSPPNPHLSTHLNIINPHSHHIHVPTWAPTTENTFFFSNCALHLSGFCHSSHIYQFLPRSSTVVPLDWEIMASLHLHTRRAVHHFWKLQDSSLVVLGRRVQVLMRAPRLYTRFFIRFQSVNEVYDVWRH